jgi:hypothetical protein
MRVTGLPHRVSASPSFSGSLRFRGEALASLLGRRGSRLTWRESCWKRRKSKIESLGHLGAFPASLAVTDSQPLLFSA